MVNISNISITWQLSNDVTGFIPHLLDLKILGWDPEVGALKAFQVIPRHAKVCEILT